LLKMSYDTSQDWPGADQLESATLRQRVMELYDRMQIEQLVVRYAHAVRDKDADLVMSLFAGNSASVDFDRSVIAGGEDKQGLSAVRKVYTDGFESLDPWPHLCNHLIELQDSTHATGIVSLELRTGKKSHQVAWIGLYRDVYEKIDGEWKFKTRAATVKKTPLISTWPEADIPG
jgi:ketosteroid isomerase-like protein